jgi:organic radical activating enzyme
MATENVRPQIIIDSHEPIMARLNIGAHILRRIPVLLNVSIEPTNDCNLNCSYCLRTKREIGYMSMNLFKKIIRQIPPYVRVALSFGGESILHPNFGNMVQLCKHRFRSLRVYSNGIRRYPEGIEVIVNPKPPKSIITEDFKIDPDSPFMPKPKRSYCQQLYRYLAILWNGDVTLCCSDIQGSHVIGNLKTQSLKQVWDSSEYEELRTVGHCVGCEVYRYI